MSDQNITVQIDTNQIDVSVEAVGSYDVQKATLTDGSSIALDLKNKHESWFDLDTSETAITMTISNALARSIGDITLFKNIAGDCVVTFQGTGYKFICMKDKAAAAASKAITLSDSSGYPFEISLKVTNKTDGGDTVILIDWQ